MLVAPELDAPPLRRHAPPELVKPATPAAGAAFTQAVNDGYWWRLLSIAVRLDTDANAANRTLYVDFLDDGGVTFLRCGNPVTYPANTSDEDFFFSIWQDEGAWEVSAANLGRLASVLIQPAWSFKVAIGNIQTGDTLTNIRYLVERFEAPSAADYPYG